MAFDLLAIDLGKRLYGPFAVKSGEEKAIGRVLTGRTEGSSLIGREVRAATLYSVKSARGSGP
jgi:hypothetical protein